MKYAFALFLLFVVTILSLFAAQFIALFLVTTAYNIPFMEFTAQMQNIDAHPELRTPILILQGITQLFGFLGASLFFVKYVYKFNQANQNSGAVHVLDSNLAQQILEEPFLRRYKTPALIFLVVLVLAFVVFPAVKLTGMLNGAIEFPSFLQGVENWMRLKEKEAETLTLFMIDFATPLQAVLGFVVVAILAGLTEEVFFRGVLQPLFQNLTKNKHAAIWITAAIFSAIHFQFFGFIPRMLLGALFGYLYIYTNNILVPIWAHILNNGITLIIGLSIDKTLLNSPQAEEINFMTILLGIASIAICIVIVKFIKTKMEQERQINEE